MESKPQKIIIATGGSGGHVIPAETLALKLKEQGHEVYILGHKVTSNRFFQVSQIEKFDIEASSICLSKLPSFVMKTASGFIRALRFFNHKKPDLVVGFGSYHSFPVLLAAFCTKIPLALYEANTSMGKVIKLFSKKAVLVASPFDFYSHLNNFTHVKPLIRHDQDQVTSNEDAYSYFCLSKHKKTLLIMGGSQGADFFNSQAINKISSSFDPEIWQIIHLTGKGCQIERLLSSYVDLGFGACCKSFENHMSLAYAVADLVICRSGATTIFELAKSQKPAILIPFPKSKDNHQLLNALHYAKHGKAYVVCEELFDHTDLVQVTEKVLSESSQAWDAYFETPKSLENLLVEECLKT